MSDREMALTIVWMLFIGAILIFRYVLRNKDDGG